MKQTVTESEQRVFISEHRKHSQDTENKVVREILEYYKDLFICSLFSFSSNEASNQRAIRK
jgi:hypothetical protein